MIESIDLKLAIVSTYPPTECGIATYTKAIADVSENYFLKNKIKIAAIESAKKRYDKRVFKKIIKNDPTSYTKTAEFINNSDMELVSLQHEYGLYGGKDGKFILNFLETIKKPVVTTMHSVLSEHSEHRHELTQKILDKSQAIVVMTKTSKTILNKYFNTKNKKIYVVPHGGPNVKPETKDVVKQQFGYKNKILFSTFGLINSGKGIEYAIKAIHLLPAKYKKNIQYLIIGATHPDIKKRDGEVYRHKLVNLVKKYKLEKCILFVDKYLTYQELVSYLKATDIYLAPQLDLNQAVSGTLAYALCSNNVIISTPTSYAKEILANHRGILTKAKDAKQLSNNILKLISDTDRMEKIRFNAYRYARSMIFPRVNLEYLRVFEIESQRKQGERLEQLFDKFHFAPSIRHIQNMTTRTGMIQHAQLDLPDMRFGYSIDDQARALIIVAKYCLAFGICKKYKKLIKTYLRYIVQAQQKNKFFHNFMDKEGYFIDDEGSGDSYGRTMWALGYISQFSKECKTLAQKAKAVFRKNMYLHKKISRIRSKAYLLLGLYHAKEKSLLVHYADDIVKYFNKNSTKKWPWFEKSLTYANAIIPYSLLKAYKLTHKKKYLNIAEQSFKFLDKTCRINDFPAPIGQDGWYVKGGKKNLFDQQAIDTADMVLCAMDLYNITKKTAYFDIAKDWFRWFHGNNVHHISLYDYATAGCCDGLTRTGINLNQGAESILVYFLAYLKIIRSIKK